MFGEHTQGMPRVAATDGGIIEAGDDAELLDDTAADKRPAACGCDEFHTDTGLPCWPCYRDGFDTPADE